uniref:Ig-like domain-containing protein n=1 Tax=Labrus bergylta TaxID=56723 RepID=A0A3Q3ECV0_9LABR
MHSMKYFLTASSEYYDTRFNQTGGLFMIQFILKKDCCEWDDETGDVNGYDQHGYDGEDFIAVFIKQKWDKDKAQLEYLKYYFTDECPDWLKKFVNYGRSSLMRTDLPTVSLLQKTPSSRVTCHATGFYPNRAMMFWRKDGEELHEDISADLQLPSDDWGKYDCVFQLSGVKEDIVTKLDKREIKTNYGKTSMRSDEREDLTVTVVESHEHRHPIIAIIAALVLLGLAVIGYKKYRGRKCKRHKLCSFWCFKFLNVIL